MSTIQGRPASEDDEISLVDLALIIVRRRRAFYLAFGACLLAGMLYLAFSKPVFQYVSLVQVAASGRGEPLVPPASIIGVLGNQWLPEVRANYQIEHGMFPPSVAFDNPKDTQLIRIVSEATENQKDAVQAVHERLIGEIRSSQEKLVDQSKKALNRQLDTANRLIDSFNTRSQSSDALAGAIDRKIELENEVSSLSGFKSLVVARKGVFDISPSWVLIIALLGSAGVVFGVLCAFAWEFVLTVRKRLKAES